MKNNNLNSSLKVAPLISLAIFIVLIAYASYAYYAASASVTNSVVNVNLNAPARATFNSVGGGETSVNVPAEFFSTANLGTYYKVGTNTYTAVSNLNVSVTGAVTCSYNLKINWIGDSYTPSSGMTSSNFEFSIQAVKNSTTVVAEKAITDYAGENIQLTSGSTIGSTSGVTDQWHIYTRIYDRPYDQASIYGHNFRYNIFVDNVNCT